MMMRLAVALLFSLLSTRLWAFSGKLPRHLPSRNQHSSRQMSSDFETAAENEINEAESQLRQAMLESDVKVLDSLLDDKLVFTNHLGVTMGKEDDLEAHQQKVVQLKHLTLSDLQIQVLPPGTTGVVTVAAHIVGSFLGDPFEDTLRFTRIWQKEDDGWKVVAAHSSLVHSS